jgi:hypothetical protein
VRGVDLGAAVERLKREPGRGLLVGGVRLPLALAEMGLIDSLWCIPGWWGMDGSADAVSFDECGNDAGAVGIAE